MYETFYGLRERPFDLISDSRFMLLTSKHREALSALKYGIAGRKGLTLLIGEAGTGKTTVIRKALDEFQADEHQVGYLSNPTLKLGEFIEWLAVEFKLSDAATASKARFLRELTETLGAHREAGHQTGLIVDEAQSLPTPLLEEIRLLSNIETPTEKLFPVVLAAQPEIVERLNEPGLRQLKQRIALRSTLLPLEGPEVAAYLAGRIQRAGGTPAQLFTREAVMAIAEFGKGIPRVISVICDNALIHGLALGRRPVSRDIIEEVCNGLDLKKIAADGSTSHWSPEVPVKRTDISLEVVETPRAAQPAFSSGRDQIRPIEATEASEPETRTDRFNRLAPRSRFLWWSRSVSGVRE
jgi:general secretion pathway protein A